MVAKVLVNAGDRYGRLVIVSEAQKHTSPSGQTQRCFCVKCDCGTELIVPLSSMRSGNTTSCGCFHREVAAETDHTTHGMTRTPTYRSWQAMRERVVDPRPKVARVYRDRGITVCARWEDFVLFVTDMGPRPQGTTLDRIDNSKGYEPSNCRWATAAIQGLNKRTTRFVNLAGETISLREASKRLGVDPSTPPDRATRRGISLQDAIDQIALQKSVSSAPVENGARKW